MKVTFECGHTGNVPVGWFGSEEPARVPEVGDESLCWGWGCLQFRSIVAVEQEQEEDDSVVH